MSHLHLQAHAKLNLTLFVLGRFESGMHEISSLICPLELADSLELKLRRLKGAESRYSLHTEFSSELTKHLEACEQRSFADKRVLNEHFGLIGRSNLAARAADSFFSYCRETSKVVDTDFTVDIRLRKNVPLQAGLGGGSSDAAAVLRGLNSLMETDLSDLELSGLAATLGSDVTAAVVRDLVIVSGEGEGVEKFQDAGLRELLSGLYLIILKPTEGMSTPEAYSLFELEKGQRRPSAVETDQLRESFYQAETDVSLELISNDFEPYLRQRSSGVNQAFELLELAGATKAQLAGSGSSVVGIFRSEEEKMRALKIILQKMPSGWYQVCTRFLTSV